MNNSLLGNEEIKRELEAGRFHQAYLITGERGSGKKTLARLMAERMTKDQRGRVARGEHPDVLWLAPKERGKMIPVEEVRTFRAEAAVLPGEALRKVMIIDGCGSLNDSGQNAILKILEEPPERVTFLLLAESPAEVLPTIRSRCVLWEMGPVPLSSGTAFIKERVPEAKRPEILLRAAGGNLGRAMDYLEEGTLIPYGELGVRVLGKLCRGKMLEADQLIGALPKGDFSLFLESFSRLCHDFLLYKTTNNEENIVFLESILQIRGFLGRMKLAKLYQMAALTLAAREQLAGYGNENLVKTCFIVQMGELLN